MQTTACKPVARAVSRPLKKIGMVITHLDRQRESVFGVIRDPDCRLALLRPVSSAYESWRGVATLAPKFHARIKAWPVEAMLRPGLSLGPEQGLERWDAERGLAGLLTGDSDYVELAAEILESNAGCALELPGGVTAVLIGEEHFSEAVKIGEPVHLSDPTMN